MIFFPVIVALIVVLNPTNASDNGLVVNDHQIDEHITVSDLSTMQDQTQDQDRKLRRRRRRRSAAKAVTVNSLLPLPGTTLVVEEDSSPSVSLDFNIKQISGISYVTFNVNLEGQRTKSYKVNGDKLSYSIDLEDVPLGQHSWDVQVRTTSRSRSIKWQTFGPWDVSVKAEALPPPSNSVEDKVEDKVEEPDEASAEEPKSETETNDESETESETKSTSKEAPQKTETQIDDPTEKEESPTNETVQDEVEDEVEEPAEASTEESNTETETETETYNDTETKNESETKSTPQAAVEKDESPSKDTVKESIVETKVEPRKTQVTVGLQADCQTISTSEFNICLDLMSASGRYESWMEDFGAAKARWQEILKDDGDGALNIDPYWSRNRNYIATALPARVDDIYISGFVQPNDGVGGVLGMAGPHLAKVSGSKKRPIAGFMIFDSADVSLLQARGSWSSVIMHEMGHVLGIGTQWAANGLHRGFPFNTDVYTRSSKAQQEWEKICPGGRIPVETDGGWGTAGGHWDEQCLGSEMMTGYLTGHMPLSRLTIATLDDMGYSVDYSKADPFTIDDISWRCAREYCPTKNRRNLRRGAEKESEMDMNTSMNMSLGHSHKRKLSEEGRRKVLLAAAANMAQARAPPPPSSSSLSQQEEQDGRDLADDLEIIPGDYVTVYIQDSDGEMKDETVTWEDVERFVESEKEQKRNDNIFDHDAV